MTATTIRGKQRSRRRPAPSTLTIREAFEMAEVELRREAGIYELAPTAAAHERARELYDRAGELRRRRERLR